MASIFKLTGTRAKPWRAQVRVKYKGHTLHNETADFERRNDAQAWARDRESVVKHPDNLARLKIGVLTVGRLIREYQDDLEEREARGLPVKYGRTKRTTLAQLRSTSLAEIDATELTPSDLLRHLTIREDEGAGPATISNDLTWLGTVFRWAKTKQDPYPVSLDAIEDARDSAKHQGRISKSQKRDRRPAPNELETLAEHFVDRDGRASIPMHDIMWFAVHSARRQSEITGLLWSDLDRDNLTILVRGIKHPKKQNVNRRAKLTLEAFEIIERQPETDKRIFPYDPRSVGAAFTRACKLLDIEDLRFHDLRHEACTRLILKGYSIAELRAFSLHDGLTQLQRYINIKAEDVVLR